VHVAADLDETFRLEALVEDVGGVRHHVAAPKREEFLGTYFAFSLAHLLACRRIQVHGAFLAADIAPQRAEVDLVSRFLVAHRDARGVDVHDRGAEHFVDQLTPDRSVAAAPSPT